MTSRRRCAVCAVLSAWSFLAFVPVTLLADVTPAGLFGDHMVLQREMPVPVWGTAAPGEAVTVSIAGQSAAAVADAQGKWMVKLKPLKAGGPFEMTVKGNNTITLTDVLVGEVWLCGGQSNMAMRVQASMNWKGELADCDYPRIRQFGVPSRAVDTPQQDVAGRWSPCGATTVAGFTAAGYFFGRKLHDDLDVPIGLINSNWGGTCAEAWTSAEVLDKHPAFKPYCDSWLKAIEEYPEKEKAFQAQLDAWQKEAEKAKAAGEKAPPRPSGPRGPRDPNRPANLYNGMIAPLAPYAMRGAIWYQGESNAGRWQTYQELLTAMITDWRTRWGQGEFPFYIVQLADFMAESNTPSDPAWARLRETQVKVTQTVPNTGLACIIDTGEANDIHPRNKQDVGRRLALLALAKTYGKDIVDSGPVYKSMTVEGGKVRVTFSSTGGGLAARTSPEPSASNMAVEGYQFALGNGPVKGFAVAGKDKVFHWADAAIDGDAVVLSCKEVAEPVAVRYAWANNPDCNLYNADGLPAVPFRTDDW